MGLFDIFKSTPGSADLKRLQSRVDNINALESVVANYTDEDLRNQTYEFKNRLAAGETLDDIADEAFAVVRETAKRLLNMRHYDVQLIGGMVIHEGKIAEMRTGEGKTLVATLPVYLNALSGKGVHVVTVNDYLARRDLVWMGQIYTFLGLTSATINSGSQSYQYDETAVSEGSDTDQERDQEGYFKIEYDYLKPITRQQAYQCDVTYGTNSEFGFDYLRDNLVYDLGEKVQRDHSFVIIDEIDSVLIDEARTPLIISASHQDSENYYERFADIVKNFQEGTDYLVDEKLRQIQVIDPGVQKAESILGIDNLYHPDNVKLVHHLETAVKAKALFLQDREYVKQGGEVIIVDESTGRLMPTRRWSGGLHQAIEAKEGLNPKPESRTYASITYQNYFRLYEKLSGMTGTALTSQEEFFKVYSLEVVLIPTHRPIKRIDHNDLIYANKQAKFNAIARKLQSLYEKGQPVLVGTVSVESNEELSQFLQRSGIPHQMLNAKNHEQEAKIIADAGKERTITIATNMAGRGVDIKLGGEDSDKESYERVKSLGGLYVLATERHSSRRIDNQLRGRSGRQGDPGETQFYVSLDDDLMRIFGGDRLKSIMKMGFDENQPLDSKMVSKRLESAQQRVEGHNFDARKSILAYDDVLNTQRHTIYTKRNQILEASDGDIRSYVERYLETDQARQFVTSQFEADSEKFTKALKRLLLQIIDQLWVSHLETMDFLRTSVNLKAYGQQEPIVEYKKEGLIYFRALEDQIESHTKAVLEQMASQVEAYQAEQKRLQQVEQQARQAREKSAGAVETGEKDIRTIVNSDQDNIGRNDLVVITKDGQKQELKFKKALPMLDEGWELVGKAN